MEEIRLVALANYNSFSEEQKEEINKIFSAMDKNGDEKVDYLEFFAYCKEIYGGDYYFHSLFHLIDQNGDDKLDFQDVMTLCYIWASGRPFCDGCKKFITGLFFTCVCCRFESSESYDLCTPCYNIRRFYFHRHTEFLDNYTFSLQLQTEINGAEETNSQPPQSQNTLEAPASSYRRGNSKGKRKSAFEFIVQALSVAASAATLATVGGN
ncbi:Calcium-binding EF-hand family protein [Quillaja saponaria]|uniref:Calcium-binding EF-hand family protein n=1 Tax=Quillaja saponaria TaxID=32244 RepID=A0AAD7VL51_QUISA|nr:Calcium-binding EF-hand family protein [Quillaja saponaria]